MLGSRKSPWRKGFDAHERQNNMREAAERFAQEEFLDITPREDLSPLETRLEEVLPGVGDARHQPKLWDDES